MFISRLGASLLMARKPRRAKKVFADIRQLTKQLALLNKRGTYMQAIKKQLKQNLTLIFFSTLLLALHPAIAETDLEAQEQYLRARVKSHQQNTDHAAHVNPIDKSLDFHGVFYGFLPCNDCNGIKTTLSLKQNNNYLLVTQPARESSREYYEKGKYSWNDENHTVILTPRKESGIRQYHIENEGTLVQLSSGGARMTGDEADRYILRRSDTVKSREVHIH
jgi:uncharacterized lipoprotein NlpE involved in copper resistance